MKIRVHFHQGRNTADFLLPAVPANGDFIDLPDHDIRGQVAEATWHPVGAGTEWGMDESILNVTLKIVTNTDPSRPPFNHQT